jgi:hypothetical protein
MYVPTTSRGPTRPSRGPYIFFVGPQDFERDRLCMLRGPFFAMSHEILDQWGPRALLWARALLWKPYGPPGAERTCLLPMYCAAEVWQVRWDVTVAEPKCFAKRWVRRHCRGWTGATDGRPMTLFILVGVFSFVSDIFELHEAMHKTKG